MSRIPRSGPPRWAGAAALALTGAVTLAGCSAFNRDGDPPPATLVPSIAASLPPVPTADLAGVTGEVPSPRAVPGYTYAEAPAEVRLRSDALARRLAAVYNGVATRTVSRDGRAVGTLVLYTLHPELRGNAKAEQALLAGMVKALTSQGVAVAEQKLGSQQVAVVSTDKASMIGWYRADTVTIYLSDTPDPAGTRAFAEAYLAAA